MNIFLAILTIIAIIWMKESYSLRKTSTLNPGEYVKVAPECLAYVQGVVIWVACIILLISYIPMLSPTFYSKYKLYIWVIKGIICGIAIMYSTNILQLGSDIIKIEWFDSTKVIRLYKEYYLLREYTEEEKQRYIDNLLKTLNKKLGFNVSLGKEDLEQVCKKETLMQIKAGLSELHKIKADAMLEHLKAAHVGETSNKWIVPIAIILCTSVA